jgi:hypothetical protein
MRNDGGLNWDLPAGCTDKMIDEHFGDEPMITCEYCNTDFYPEDNEQERKSTCEKCLKINAEENGPQD